MMRTRTMWLPVVVATAMTACTQLTPEQELIEQSASALGGKARLEAVSTLSIEGEGTQRNLGQDMSPEATTQTFSLENVRTEVSLSPQRVRTEQTRTPNFNYFRGPDPMQEISGLDGDVAYSVAADGTASRAPAATAEVRGSRFYHHPVILLQAALRPGATLANARTEGSEGSLDVTVEDGTSLTLTVDASTGLPTRISSRANHPNLRDVTHSTAFADYEEVDGVQLPRSIVSSIDQHQIVDFRVTSQELDSEIADLEAPEEAASAPAREGPPPVNVTSEEIADGVWFLAGQSHHSVLIEFADHLTLYEAPNEARTLAVIEKARELVPDKPVTHMISSHHHFDHSGGIRAAISEGLTIVTQAGNAAFYEELATRSSNMVPDALGANPQELTLETVDDELVLEDDSMRVELYHIAGNPHADTLLMAYLPREGLLIEVDAFSPGRDFQPFAANLLENIRERGLRVDRIVPIHGSIVPMADLERAVETMETMESGAS